MRWRVDGYVEAFFLQAEGGIRDTSVTGVQTCALPIFELVHEDAANPMTTDDHIAVRAFEGHLWTVSKIGRASCRERVESSVAGGRRKERSIVWRIYLSC